MLKAEGVEIRGSLTPVEADAALAGDVRGGHHPLDPVDREGERGAPRDDHEQQEGRHDGEHRSEQEHPLLGLRWRWWR